MKIEPLLQKLTAFGLCAVQVDGHDVAALAAPATWPPDGRAVVTLAYTNPCQGMPVLEERRPKLHYVRFKDEAERDHYQAILAQYEEMN